MASGHSSPFLYPILDSFIADTTTGDITVSLAPMSLPGTPRDLNERIKRDFIFGGEREKGREGHRERERGREGEREMEGEMEREGEINGEREREGGRDRLEDAHLTPGPNACGQKE